MHIDQHKGMDIDFVDKFYSNIFHLYSCVTFF